LPNCTAYGASLHHAPCGHLPAYPLATATAASPESTLSYFN